MSVAITAVPVVASDVQAAPVVANDTQATPAAGSHIEQPLFDFVAQMRGNPLGDASQLANPGALATELFGSLRGYLERARNLDMATRMSADDTQGGGGIDKASATPAAATETKLHGGPARERLEPIDRDSGAPAALGVSVAQLRRTMDVALASMSFWSETTLVVHGTGQVSHSTDTLLRGQ
jgi:hypothetical protein